MLDHETYNENLYSNNRLINAKVNYQAKQPYGGYDG